MRKLIYLIPLIFLLSCNPFSKKENKEEKEKRREEARKERINEENKRFQFLCELVSYRTCISQDTVIIVAKKFYEQYEYVVFDGNKIIDINYDSHTSEPACYDFVENAIKQCQLPRKEVFLIFYEIDLYYKLEYMESTISDIDGFVYGIYEIVDK